MSTLKEAIADYLAVRRALGFKLRRAELLLADFARYMEIAGAHTVTTELAVAWATKVSGGATGRPRALVWFGGSPGTGRHSIHAQRFRLRTFCHAKAAALPLSSTPKPTSSV